MLTFYKKKLIFLDCQMPDGTFNQREGTSLVVQNLPSHAGDLGSISGGETKIAHAMGQLSQYASVRDVHALQLEGLGHRGPTHHNKDPA